METVDDLTRRVRELTNAENAANRAAADAVLAADFRQITRARGDEQDRTALLNELADPSNPTLKRELVEDSLSTLLDGNLGIVRSLVRTVDTSNPQAATNTFRNIHVFQRRNDNWMCVAWQVTKLVIA